MTIAACYLSSEGVILGADSTTTMFVAAPGSQPGGREHHFNFAQKVFQVGSEGTLGMTMWGLGSLPGTSYRTLITQFADDLSRQSAASMAEIAERWNLFFWGEYSKVFSVQLQRTQDLVALSQRTLDEDMELDWNPRGIISVGATLLAWPA